MKECPICGKKLRHLSAHMKGQHAGDRLTATMMNLKLPENDQGEVIGSGPPSFTSSPAGGESASPGAQDAAEIAARVAGETVQKAINELMTSGRPLLRQMIVQELNQIAGQEERVQPQPQGALQQTSSVPQQPNSNRDALIGVIAQAIAGKSSGGDNFETFLANQARLQQYLVVMDQRSSNQVKMLTDFIAVALRAGASPESVVNASRGYADNLTPKLPDEKKGP